jgi:hypothetical protein
MIQEIITYIIIALALAKTFNGLYKFFFVKKKSACGCSGGACHSSEWNQVQHQVKINTQMLKKSA